VQYHILLYFVPLRFIKLIDNDFFRLFTKGYKMEDGRKNNGGNKNGGRKSKAEEQQLAEKLSPLEPLAFKALLEALEAGKDWAVKLFFQYNFGMPKQIIEQTINAPITEIVLTDATVKHTDA
jgi:hypothetical protein